MATAKIPSRRIPDDRPELHRERSVNDNAVNGGAEGEPRIRSTLDERHAASTRHGRTNAGLGDVPTLSDCATNKESGDTLTRHSYTHHRVARHSSLQPSTNIDASRRDMTGRSRQAVAESSPPTLVRTAVT
jgi:hypothetical protein